MKRASLKKLFLLTGIWAVITISLVQLWIFVGSSILEIILYRNNAVIQQAREHEVLFDVRFYAWIKRTLSIALPVFTAGLALLYVRAVAKSKSVHTIKIATRSGAISEIPVEQKHLNQAVVPLAVGVISVNELEAITEGHEQAEVITRYKSVVDASLKLANAEISNRVQVRKPAALPPAEAEFSGKVPTFQGLLLAEELAPGKSMILGYQNGLPRRGSFLDIYSAAIAGESGSGKTATELFLIGSGLVTSCGHGRDRMIRFLGIDPHYPHPKSLGFKTRPLWEAGLMHMATNKVFMLEILNEVEQIIDDRLQQIDTSTTPVVLVIDELAFLSKTKIGGQIAHAMERISTEGRKCDVYMLASSQTWLTSRTGDSSAVRDNLTSAFVHRIKPKQANLLLQDKDDVDKVKKYVKQAGDVLLVPVNDDSVICKMPYTTEADMQTVTRIVQERLKPLRKADRSVSFGRKADKHVHKEDRPVSFKALQEPCQKPDTEDLDAEFVKMIGQSQPAATDHAATSTASDTETAKSRTLKERIKHLFEIHMLTYGKIFRETGIGKSTMHNFMNRSGSLKPEQKTALYACLERYERKAQTPTERA